MSTHARANQHHFDRFLIVFALVQAHHISLSQSYISFGVCYEHIPGSTWISYLLLLSERTILGVHINSGNDKVTYSAPAVRDSTFVFISTSFLGLNFFNIVFGATSCCLKVLGSNCCQNPLWFTFRRVELSKAGRHWLFFGRIACPILACYARPISIIHRLAVNLLSRNIWPIMLWIHLMKQYPLLQHCEFFSAFWIGLWLERSLKKIGVLIMGVLNMTLLSRKMIWAKYSLIKSVSTSASESGTISRAHTLIEISGWVV